MALYHTHRPQSFASVIGQDPIIQTIQNQILRDSVAHAYLFSGPRGVGKTTTARLIAKAVNCPRLKDSAEPDNTHEDALAISQGRSMDVIEIDAASHTGVDHVREHIIEQAHFRPTKLKYKIFIIDEVHMLSSSAFNALLKTLEEPPAHVMFILATTELHKLPATIISRCQRFTFQHVPKERIIAHLQAILKEESVEMQDTVLEQIAQQAGGCVRDAVSLLEQVIAGGNGKTIHLDHGKHLLRSDGDVAAQAIAEAMAAQDAPQALQLVQEQQQQGAHMSHLVDTLMQQFRMALKAQAMGTSSTLPLSATRLVEILDELLRRRAQISSSPLPQLPLEMAIISLCGAQGSTPQSTVKPEKAPAPDPIAPEEKEAATPVEAVVDPPTAEPLTDTPEEQSGSLTEESAKQIWTHVLNQVEEKSPTLVFILKAAQIQENTGNTLPVAVPFGFHKEKIDDVQCKAELEGYAKESAGFHVKLDIVVQENAKPEVDPALQDLASAFGGSVV